LLFGVKDAARWKRENEDEAGRKRAEDEMGRRWERGMRRDVDGIEGMERDGKEDEEPVQSSRRLSPG